MSTSEAPAKAARTKSLRARKSRPGLSIQSLVLIMLLTVSVVSNVVVGVIGYVNATDSLRDAAFQRLIEVRDSRAREVTRLYSTIENTIVVHAAGSTVVQAAKDFASNFEELESSELTAEQDVQLEDFYLEVFAPLLAEVTGKAVDAASFVPVSPAARYLQLAYTVPSPDFDSAIAVDDAGEGSAWSATHAIYHNYFRTMTERLAYEDVLLIDSAGTVVYSAYKGVDLGTNVATGPFRFTELGTAFVESVSANVIDSVTFTDFGNYAPSLAAPAGWAVTPIADNGEIVGAIAVELPIDRLSAVMTADGDPSGGGLGDTGEVYLVGPDGLMRSPSRLFAEDQDAFVAAATASGTTPEVTELAVARGTTLAVQPVASVAVDRAKSGQTGTIIGQNYLGRETLAAYRPLGPTLPGWVVIAETTTSEAFAPVTDFTRNLLVSSAILALIVSVASLVLARVIVRPLRKLSAAAKRIAAGETGVVVDGGSSDEIGSVAAAFNDMSRSLQVKAELLEQQDAESERLLRALMPEPVIKRYREGVQTIAEDHQEVSVMYADIVGFEQFTTGLDSERTLELFNELVKAFDETGSRLGVEHVRTTVRGYLASCGLTVPRIDNARRMVEFTLELDRILQRFGAQWGAQLTLRAGIDLGEVTSGLIGRAHMVYDLWGDTVNLAFQVHGGHADAGIFLTQRVLDDLADGIPVVSAGWIQTPTGGQQVWRIDAEALRA